MDTSCGDQSWRHSGSDDHADSPPPKLPSHLTSHQDSHLVEGGLLASDTQTMHLSPFYLAQPSKSSHTSAVLMGSDVLSYGLM